MMLLSYTIVDLYLLYGGAVDMQIRAHLTRSQCKVSDTQVTVKACGPLVFLADVAWDVFEIELISILINCSFYIFIFAVTVWIS